MIQLKTHTERVRNILYSLLSLRGLPFLPFRSLSLAGVKVGDAVQLWESTFWRLCQPMYTNYHWRTQEGAERSWEIEQANPIVSSPLQSTVRSLQLKDTGRRRVVHTKYDTDPQEFGGVTGSNYTIRIQIMNIVINDRVKLTFSEVFVGISSSIRKQTRLVSIEQ